MRVFIRNLSRMKPGGLASDYSLVGPRGTLVGHKDLKKINEAVKRLDPIMNHKQKKLLRKAFLESKTIGIDGDGI